MFYIGGKSNIGYIAFAVKDVTLILLKFCILAKVVSFLKFSLCMIV